MGRFVDKNKFIREGQVIQILCEVAHGIYDHASVFFGHEVTDAFRGNFPRLVEAISQFRKGLFRLAGAQQIDTILTDNPVRHGCGVDAAEDNGNVFDPLDGPSHVEVPEVIFAHG